MTCFSIEQLKIRVRGIPEETVNAALRELPAELASAFTEALDQRLYTTTLAMDTVTLDDLRLHQPLTARTIAAQLAASILTALPKRQSGQRGGTPGEDRETGRPDSPTVTPRGWGPAPR